MRRRQFISTVGLTGMSLLTSRFSFALLGNHSFPEVRVPVSQRKFYSKSVEETIGLVRSSIGNKELAWLFENCFPNTLDTTVDFSIINGKPDTYVITGDIDAMWLRDSSAQVWPYLPLCKNDEPLRQLIEGVIRRQTQCILLDPYANAFYKNPDKISEWREDLTTMKPGIHERKWEIDSLCYPIRLAYGYYSITGDASVFDSEWKAAMKRVIQTFREQQRLHSEGPYSFQRRTAWATDGVPMGGYGYPTRKIGLIHSMFRASDDVTIYPYNIPENYFAEDALRKLLLLYKAAGVHQKEMDELAQFGKQIRSALQQHALFSRNGKELIPYEIDGFGNAILMDDANVPSLLSLPYLTSLSVNSIRYQNTRKLLLSEANPYFFKGKAGEGIGGPHVGLDYIWPLSIIMRALTSTNENEIAFSLRILQNTHAGTGFMHEAFHKDDCTKFTRKWFAWANTIFGELVLKIYSSHKHLLM